MSHDSEVSLATAGAGGLRNAVQGGLAELSPASFAMVMATGIVSIAAHFQGLESLAVALLWLNLLAWAVLWVLSVLRMVRHPARFFGDMIDHVRGPGFFTMVAGTSVLGNQLVMLADDYGHALALWGISVALWIGLTYTIFTAFTIKEVKPTLEQGITGGWLLAIVATQSLAVLSALLATHAAAPWKLVFNFFALSMWLWGGMLYIWMMSLIFYRYTFSAFRPAISRRRTGSTWARWRSRRLRARSSSSTRPKRRSSPRSCRF